MSDDANRSLASVTKSLELRVFIFLVVFLAPIASIGLVGGYGLLIWMSQLVIGPPGPPAG